MAEEEIVTKQPNPAEFISGSQMAKKKPKQQKDEDEADPASSATSSLDPATNPG